MKIKNSEGEEIDVFTPEEVEAKAKEAADAARKETETRFQTENATLLKEKEEAEQKRKDAEELLKKAEEEGGSKGQIDRLRRERDDAKKAAEDAAKGIDAKLDAFRKEMAGDTKKQLLDAVSGGDAEMRKKIEFHFDNYRPNDTSPEQIKERMEAAITMATGQRPTPGMLDGRTGGGDRGAGGGYKPPVAQTQLNENQKAIGKVLGITDKDRENYEKFQKEQDQRRAAGLIPPESR